MATTVIVGNPDLNPTVNPGNDFSYQYNPADPIAAQQAQREVEARAEMDRQAMEDEYAAQLQQTFADKIGTPTEVDTSHFDPNQEIDFTSFAKNNNWADSSTFRRQELANKMLEELKAKGADANYLEGARQFIKAKGEEWKQPIDAPDRDWTDVGSDVVAGAARGINSLVGLASDVATGINPAAGLLAKAGFNPTAYLKELSDEYVGGFERNLQSAETANLIKRSNELIAEGRVKDLAKLVVTNPSLALYAGLPELLGSKGIGVAAKGVVKGIEGGLKVANVAQNVAEGTKAYKALELGKQAAGLGTVMAASGRGSILNTATTNGVPITDDVTDIANTNALAQGALGAFGAAAGSVESILAKSPIFSLFSKAGDVDRLLITATTAPKAAVSTILATAKTAGVEMSQEYAEGWVESLLQAKINPDGTTRDLNQLDYDQAAAQGVYGGLLAAGPGGIVGHMEARAKNHEIDAYNSVIKDKQAEAADVQNKAADAKRVADTINTAATTADEALATLNAERAQRIQTQQAGAAEVERLRTEAALADPLVEAEATQRLIEATTRQAEIEQRRSVLESAKDAQFQAIDAETQANEDASAVVYKQRLDQSIRNAGMDVAARPGLEWDTNFTRGELDRLRQIAPTVDFTTSKDPLKTLARAAKEAGNDPLVLGQLVRAKNLVQGTLTSNRPLAATARRVLAEGIASGQPFDVEAAIVQAAPYLAEPEVRMSFLSTLPEGMVTQLAQLDSTRQQQSLPGFAPAIEQDNFTMPQAPGIEVAAPVTPDLFPNSPEFLNQSNPGPLENAAGYANAQPQRTHARAVAIAEAMNTNQSIMDANDAFIASLTNYVTARENVYQFPADDVSPEAQAARQAAVGAFRARMEAKATLAKAQESFLQEATKSTKLQSLIVQYSDLIEKSKRNDKFNSSETRFTYAEDSAQVAADLVLEQMEQYLGIQRTNVPVVVTGEETELPGVKFNLTEYSPRVDNASIRRAAQVKNSPASNQARADRVGAVQAAVKSLNLGRVTTPEQIKNRRDAQYSKIADAEQMLQDAESRVSEAQAAVDGIVAGDKSLAAGALRARLAREKQTVTALKTKVSTLTIGLKKIDPVAYHDMRVEQARAENEAKIAELQSVLDNAQAARDAYVAENAVGAGKQYQSDIKKMDAAIDRAKKKLFDLRGEPFDYDTQKQKIETAYQEAVLKAVQITPEGLRTFDAKAKSASGKTVVPSDFIAAYDEGQQIRGTATLLDDNAGWEINYTDARGESKNTAVATSEEVFQFFRAQNLQPTLRSRGANQSTHAMKAIGVEERGNRFTRPFLKALVTVMGESRAKNMLNAVDWTLFSLANRGYALRELANRATANGYGSNLQDELQLNLAKWTAYQSQPGTTEQTHKDMEQSFYEMHQKLPKTAQPYFDEYAHAVAARSRHNWLTRDEELDKNTGLPKDRTSGFEWYDPRTGKNVKDQDGSRYFEYIDSITSQEDRVALDAAVKYLADMGLTVSHIEARNGVISEADLQQRIAEHEAGNYYLPLRDEDNSPNSFKHTKGRYSKAADPVVRMLMDMQGRIGRAARMSMVQDLHDFFVENPAPDVVTINTEVEVADGHGNVKWVMDDPFSNRSVRIIKADGTRARLTFADTGHGARLAKMLTPQNIPQWISMANTTKRYFSNMMTTFSPKMWPVQLVRDMMIIPFNFEQASRGLFGSTKSLKLAAKTSALIPVNLMRTIRGQISPDNKSVLAKELLADGGMIQLAHRNDFQAQKDILVNEADYKPTSGRRNLFGKTVKAIHYTENVLHSLDAVSRETYAQVATTELFGRKIRTAEDMALFKSQFPAEWKQILLGTKDITLNFENYGQSPYLRATIPFFGTAMNATFHALPRSLSTKSGIAYMTMLAGASYIAAMSGGAGSGEDPDGKKKFYRNSNLGRSIEIGGIAFPLPQEMYFAHMFGTAIAATQDDQWDFGRAASEVAASFIEGFSPVQVSDSPNMADRVLAAGPYGFILQPMITGNDAFGRPLANPKPVGQDGKRIEDPADWEGAYKNSAEWAKITTATLADGTGGVIDISPGGAETAARIMLGGAYLFAKDYGKDVSTVDNLLSRFTPKENPYKMGQEYNELESKYNRLSRDPAVAGDMLNPASTAKRLIDANKKTDAQISRQVGALTKAMTTAKLQGNTANAEAYQSQIDALNASREQNKGSVMKQIQELEK